MSTLQWPTAVQVCLSNYRRRLPPSLDFSGLVRSFVSRSAFKGCVPWLVWLIVQPQPAGWASFYLLSFLSAMLCPSLPLVTMSSRSPRPATIAIDPNTPFPSFSTALTSFVAKSLDIDVPCKRCCEFMRSDDERCDSHKCRNDDDDVDSLFSSTYPGIWISDAFLIDGEDSEEASGGISSDSEDEGSSSGDEKALTIAVRGRRLSQAFSKVRLPLVSLRVVPIMYRRLSLRLSSSRC